MLESIEVFCLCYEQKPRKMVTRKMVTFFKYLYKIQNSGLLDAQNEQ